MKEYKIIPPLACTPHPFELIMLTQYLSAPVEGISGKTWGTGACGIVVNDLTACLDATSAGTRVHALLILTVEILGAIRANDALGSTAGR